MATLTYNLERTIDPTEEPLTLAAAKLQCSIEASETEFDDWLQGDGDDDDGGAIQAAREAVERDAFLALMPQTWELRFDDWPLLSTGGEEDYIDLLIHPVQSVVITYDDANDANQTWAASNYELQVTRYRSIVMKADLEADYPELSTSKPRPVKVTITAGYSNTTDQTTEAARRNKVPMTARMAMQLLIGHWFRNREAVVVGTVSKDIEQGYRSLIDRLRPTRY